MNRLDPLRQEVSDVNQALPMHGLVTMHSGNASGVDREQGVIFIKPSGMDYDKVTSKYVVPVRLVDGEPLIIGLRPSVDVPHHLYLYRHMPEVGGIVHTHSNYATAFAAVGKPIEPFLTAIADEFGGAIPCAPYADNEGDHIGESILRHKTDAPAILLANHGVFAWGATPKDALKTAVMVEDVAKTVWLAMQIGTPAALPPDEVAKWFDRYRFRYGQK